MSEKQLDALNGWKRSHYCNELREANVGEEVCLMGWVQHRRDHGGLIFIDLRDRTGLTQAVFSPDTAPKAHAKAHDLRTEYVVAIKGKVINRPLEMINKNLPTGEIEIEILEFKLLNDAQTPPFPIEDRVDVSENLRLKYRYLDLRRAQLSENLILRSKVAGVIRNHLQDNNFLEIETPILTKSTPEGARDFLVPSRVNQGSFYALPQSPQMFKQLLMCGGMDRYFQIVRCFRDEDLRADRQPEFTQIDIEMSFADEKDIMDLAENMIKDVFSKVMNISLNYEFARMTYKTAIEKYGLDKPDTRFELFLQDVTEIVRSSDFKVFANAKLVKALHIKGGAVMSRKDIDDLTDFVKIYGAQGLAWIKIKEDKQWQSPIVKFLGESCCQALGDFLRVEAGDIVFFQAGEPEMVNTSLGQLRLKVAEICQLIPKDSFAFTWVTDFPLFEWDEENKRFCAKHHPFTAPNQEHVEMMSKNPGQALARAYDLVLNGSEIGGGSVRIHTSEMQSQMFAALGIDSKEAKDKFGFFIEAMSYGAPPHCGIAFGLDRIIMLLCNATSIRDVIAFPKTQKGLCLMTEAPSSVSNEQLRDLGIRLREKDK